MNDTSVDDWSPADNPYAIAVSDAQWWQRTAALAVRRIRAGDEGGDGFSTRQIDARQLCIALHQLLIAEKLEQIALKELGIDPAVGRALSQAREQFEAALPGIKQMRDGLTHFEDWSRGKGRGSQAERVKAGVAPRDVARDFWSFGYDATTATVTMGPYGINVDTADRAAIELARDIYTASREVGKKDTAELRDRAVQALVAVGIRCDQPGRAVLVSPGNDLRVWMSLNFAAVPDVQERQDLSVRVCAALDCADLRLASSTQPQVEDSAERLASGGLLQVQRRS